MNPAGDKRVERFGWTFPPGDKVMQIEDVDLDEGEVAVNFVSRTVIFVIGL